MTSVALPMSSGGHCFNEKENLMPPAKGDSKEMDEGFAPSEFDVLVGWARQNFHHEGNRRFRDLINEHVSNYMVADTKIARGQIINTIVNSIKGKSPSGTGFLKLNPYTATWIFIGTDKAKDKVGHALRKAVVVAKEEAEKKLMESEEYKSASRKRRLPPNVSTSQELVQSYDPRVEPSSELNMAPSPSHLAERGFQQNQFSPVGRDIFDNHHNVFVDSSERRKAAMRSSENPSRRASHGSDESPSSDESGKAFKKRPRLSQHGRPADPSFHAYGSPYMAYPGAPPGHPYSVPHAYYYPPLPHPGHAPHGQGPSAATPTLPPRTSSKAAELVGPPHATDEGDEEAAASHEATAHVPPPHHHPYYYPPPHHHHSAYLPPPYYYYPGYSAAPHYPGGVPPMGHPMQQPTSRPKSRSSSEDTASTGHVATKV